MLRISDEKLNFCGPKVLRVDGDQQVRLVRGVVRLFVYAFALPHERSPTASNAALTNSRTECISPVAIT